MMVVMGMISRIMIIVIIPICITHNGSVETLRFLARSNAILKFKIDVYYVQKYSLHKGDNFRKSGFMHRPESALVAAKLGA
jgi:hypothetical protein